MRHESPPGDDAAAIRADRLRVFARQQFRRDAGRTMRYRRRVHGLIVDDGQALQRMLVEEHQEGVAAVRGTTEREQACTHSAFFGQESGHREQAG